MRHCVGIVELPVAVVKNLHPCCDALIAVNHLAVNVQPDNGQVGLGQSHMGIGGHEVIPPAVGMSGQCHCHCSYE